MSQTPVGLTLRPFLRTRPRPTISSDDPVAVHVVDGVPNNQIIYIVNKRAHGREPLWHIRYVHLDAEIGDYKTAEEAMAVLQGLFEESTGLMAALHKAECNWFEKWRRMPEHPLAKADHRDVEAWERIVRTHVHPQE